VSPKERAKTNQKQMKSVTQWFVLPRFGSCKPTPRWGGHKDRVSFNPFPLSNGHLDRVSFSPQSIGSLRPHKDHHTIGVSCFDYNGVENKNGEEEKRSKQQELKWTQMSLSQATKSLECVWDLERIWSLLLCLGVKSRALVLNVMAENLDALKCSGWGVFITPTTKMVVGRGCCRWAHRTVQCGSHVTQLLGFDHWSSDMWGHRTVWWCTGQVLFTILCAFWRLLWLCANCPRTVALLADR
jgi:hypothetical protein